MLGVFLDTETNGLNPERHCILEIAYQIVDLMTGQKIGDFHSVIQQNENEWAESDPESLEINGFLFEDIQKGNPHEKVRMEMIASFARFNIKRGNAVFICQNPSFDRPFFSQLISPDLSETLLLPYHWLDLASMYWSRLMLSTKDPISLFQKINFSKDQIAAYFNLPAEVKPHRAMNGVEHLLLCYRSVVGFKK